MNILVVADDLTGALDTGVRFARSGVSTKVLLSLKELDQAADDVQALVIDTDSRHLSAHNAARRVGRLADWAVRMGIPYIYKKTDSVLRGNIGPEIKAIMDACNRPAMFLPAFPEAGRTTLGGRQYVNGIPLESSECAHDPLNPVITGVVAEIITASADVQVLNVPLRSEWPALNQPNTVYVFDCIEESDLSDIAGRLRQTGCLSVCAGCAGFASYLADVLHLERSKFTMPTLVERTLIICGSTCEKSLRQLASAEELGYVRIVLSDEQLTGTDYWNSTTGQESISQMSVMLQEKGRLLIQSMTEEGNNMLSLSHGGMPLSSVKKGDLIVRNLACLASGILAVAGFCTLVVIGGDTTRGILNAIAASDIRPIEEIEPGVALSWLNSRFGKLGLISKGGGLGGDHMLTRMDHYIRRYNRS